MPIEVVSRVATIYAVIAVGIYQLAEILVSLYQRFSIFGCIAEMYVVVSLSVTEQQGTMQIVYTADGTVVITCSILLWRTHIALGINRIVIAP